MSWSIFVILSGFFLFLTSLFLKFHLFKPCYCELVDNEFGWKLKRVKYPVWELILVSIVCWLPIINWIALGIQLLFISTALQDKEYIFYIINLDNVCIDIYNEKKTKETLNKFKEQWAQTHKFEYKLYKTIKSIFTFSVV